MQKLRIKSIFFTIFTLPPVLSKAELLLGSFTLVYLGLDSWRWHMQQTSSVRRRIGEQPSLTCEYLMKDTCFLFNMKLQGYMKLTTHMNQYLSLSNVLLCAEHTKILYFYTVGMCSYLYHVLILL